MCKEGGFLCGIAGGMERMFIGSKREANGKFNFINIHILLLKHTHQRKIAGGLSLFLQQQGEDKICLRKWGF